jgi:cellulose synthase/poly-beta-1,6-N-acetylglucosamine synthase-like glycosyltransferase
MTDAVWVGAVLAGLGAAHLLYTYVGYPWLISLLPARPPRPGGVLRRHLVSVVIAARGGVGAAIVAKVTDLLGTIRLPCQIIVVVDGPDDSVSSALHEIADERLTVDVLPRRQGKAVALNRAVELARGDVLVFTDVRQHVAPGAVEELVAGLASPDVGAVSGALTISGEAGREGLYERYWRLERRLRSQEAAWDSAVGVSGALYALKRELWEPLPSGLLLDDVWVPLQVIRAGQRVGFAPRAVATDVRSGSDAVELARKVRTLTGNYQLLAWMPSLLHPGRNRIWWQFVSHKVLRLMTPLAACSLIAGGLVLAGPWARIVAGLGGLGAALAVTVGAGRKPALPGSGVLGAARSGLVLCTALVVAAVNAARGRWDVWSEAGRRT